MGYRQDFYFTFISHCIYIHFHHGKAQKSNYKKILLHIYTMNTAYIFLHGTFDSDFLLSMRLITTKNLNFYNFLLLQYLTWDFTLLFFSSLMHTNLGTGDGVFAFIYFHQTYNGGFFNIQLLSTLVLRRWMDGKISTVMQGRNWKERLFYILVFWDFSLVQLLFWEWIGGWVSMDLLL